MDRNIIITGATSFIAIALINKFIEEQDTVYAVVRPNSVNMSKIPTSKFVKIVSLDMAEISRLIEFVPEEIDALYHFAWEGMRGADRNNAELQMRNHMFSKKIFEVAVAMKIRIVLGSGSQAEYGVKTDRITEESETVPICEYGKAKLQTYKEGMQLCQNTGTTFVWTRIFSIYGTGDYDGSLIMSTIHKMLCNEPIALSPCTHRWNFLYCGDLAEVLYLFSIRMVSAGVYNLASDDTRILKDYILELKNMINSNSELLFGAIPYTGQGNAGIWPDITKVKNLLEWSPNTSFRDGISKIFEEQVV